MRIVAAVLCLLAAAPICADEPTAWDLFERGRAAEKAKHIAQAYLFYAQAAAMDPKNQSYWQHAQAIRTRAALEGLVMPETAAVGAAPDPAPDDAPPPFKPEVPSARDLWDACRQSSPPELVPDDGTGVIDLHGDSKPIWQDLAKIFGLDCVFDGDYQPSREMRFRLKSVDYRVAMRGLEAATGTFVFPITSKVFMVAKDTPQKRTELQPRVAMSVALPDSVTQQDFNQAVTAVQQAVGIEKIAFDTQSKTVILRDTPVKVAAARALLHDLTRPPAQVMVQLKMIEVTRNDMVTYGIDFPTLFSLNTLTNWLNNQLTLPTNVSGFLSFGGGKTLMGLGIISPALVAQLSRASSGNLLDSEMRTTDGLAATMHIGEQYPVLTSQYLGPSELHRGRHGIPAAPILPVRRSRAHAEGDALRALARFRDSRRRC